jgi:signal peptidase I
MSWFLLFSILPALAGLYKIFEKSGIPGWKALVPVYNFVVWIKLVKAPWWWIFLVIIPTVGFFMLAIVQSFRKTKIHRSCVRGAWLLHLVANERIFQRC